MGKYKVAVLGASGAVGRKMIKVLEERNFPVESLKLLASPRSAGTKIPFNGNELTVEAVSENSFDGIDVALFSPGSSVSKKYAPFAVAAGCVVVDNSSAFRMDENVPLVVPEVNPHAVDRHQGIIANPNCSTIQMVVALQPIRKAAGIKRVVVSTYQAVGGAGQKGIKELEEQTKALVAGETYENKAFPYQISYNAIPHIDVFLDNGYTKEEMKMVHETQKIMEDDSIEVSPTAVRIPVFVGHSEAVNVECVNPLTLAELKQAMSEAEGLVVMDDPANTIYPTPIFADDKDEVFVGRIRKDLSIPNCFNMWVVSDNLRKGAATNAVQIAELLVKRGLI